MRCTGRTMLQNVLVLCEWDRVPRWTGSTHEMFHIFTAPHVVRRRGGGVMFSQVFFCSGGTPVPGSFPGLWSKILSWRDTPVLAGGYPSLSWGEYPRTGYPLASTEVPPSWDWGNTPSPPRKTEQQSKYLLHVGRYASCSHAGGLSCCLCIVSRKDAWIQCNDLICNFL